MTDHIAEKIKNADLILVGLGEEMDVLRNSKTSLPDHLGEESSWLLPFADKVRTEELAEEKGQCYSKLAACLENRNYFIVTLCQDGLIHQYGFREDRIVEPCGGYEKLQCSKACSADLYELPVKLMDQVKIFLKEDWKDLAPEEPVCPKCGSPLVFNRVDAVSYVEEGYLEKWGQYKKWLQGTVNKNVCILELGVGMKYPSVIRWPFEKIVFFNQKAELFRVHSRLYQISEEIKGRGHGIRQRPEEFLKELSNAF